jgi:excisionase family DNA binding protein
VTAKSTAAAEIWLTTADAAARTKRHPRTVLHAANSGALKSTQPGRGRGRRYRPEWLDEWMEQEPPAATRVAS